LIDLTPVQAIKPEFRSVTAWVEVAQCWLGCSQACARSHFDIAGPITQCFTWNEWF